jgi:hypothetical protein
MSVEPIFNYGNSWSSPRFFFKQNIGDFVGATSLNITLDEFTESKNFFRTTGSFKVSGNYSSVKQFAQLLERDYGKYLTFEADWPYYDSIVF